MTCDFFLATTDLLLTSLDCKMLAQINCSFSILFFNGNVSLAAFFVVPCNLGRMEDFTNGALHSCKGIAFGKFLPNEIFFQIKTWTSMNFFGVSMDGMMQTNVLRIIWKISIHFFQINQRMQRSISRWTCFCWGGCGEPGNRLYITSF